MAPTTTSSRMAGDRAAQRDRDNPASDAPGHTPGPWRLRARAQAGDSYRVTAKTTSTGRTFTVAWIETGREDARLIARAWLIPDLVAALRTSNERLTEERETVLDHICNSLGQITEPIDWEALGALDVLIARNRALISCLEHAD